MSRLSKGLLLASAVAVVVGLGALAWQARQQVQTVGVTVGDPAPSFVLPALSGSFVNLSALRGRPVMLNFFTSFCQACRNEAPGIEQLQQRFAGRAQVIGMDLTVSEPSLEAVRQYVAQFDISYPIALDRTGSTADRYGVSAIPLTVFVDRNGKVRSVVTGQMGSHQMMSQMQAVVGTDP